MIDSPFGHVQRVIRDAVDKGADPVIGNNPFTIQAGDYGTDVGSIGHDRGVFLWNLKFPIFIRVDEYLCCSYHDLRI